MAITPSTMLALGTPAPDFSLPSTSGSVVSLGNFKNDRLLVVAFICNHCPFVKHIRAQLAAVAETYQARGVGFVAINSNDIVAFPADNMEQMQKESETVGYTFPYLLDEEQTIARAYDAACTPDFYIFDSARKLVYRGQFDSSRPGTKIPVTGQDLCAAMDAALNDKQVAQNQSPSIGCNIKWKPGNEPN